MKGRRSPTASSCSWSWVQKTLVVPLVPSHVALSGQRGQCDGFQRSGFIFSGMYFSLSLPNMHGRDEREGRVSLRSQPLPAPCYCAEALTEDRLARVVTPTEGTVQEAVFPHLCPQGFVTADTAR